MIEKVRRDALVSVKRARCSRGFERERKESAEVDQPLRLLALTLREPSGGHCVELKGKAGLSRKQWARRAHCLFAPRFSQAKMKALRSGPRREEAKVGLLFHF